jgi:hypothetical protein
VSDAKLQKIDPGKLKLRELAELERLLGRKLAGELQTGELGMDTMTGLLWIAMRNQDPAATFVQAGVYDLETLMGLFADDEADDEAEGDGVDPTASPPDSAANGSRSSGELTSKPMLPSTTSGG